MPGRQPMDADRDAAGIAKRKHVCRVCSKAFKRSEHRIRHERGHTQEKPFSCQYCHKQYNRKDLVVRHERTLHAQDRLLHNHSNNEGVYPKSTITSKGDAGNPASSPDDSGRNSQQGEIEVGSSDTVVVSTDQYTLPQPQRTDPVAHAPIINVNPRNLTEGMQTNATFVDAQIPANRTTDRENTNPEGSDLTRSPLVGLNFSAMGNPITCLDEATFSMELDMPALDFFDPFLGSTYDNFALPALPAGSHLFSPPGSFDHENAPGYGSSGPGMEVDPTLSPLPSTGTMINQNGEIIRPTQGQPRVHVPKTLSSLISKAPTQTPGRQVKLYFSSEAHKHTWDDLQSRLSPQTLGSFSLPSPSAMQKWLRVYVEAFHVHFPFIHLSSLDLEHTPSPLILAISAIGALYRLKRSAATTLHVKTIQCLAAAESNIAETIVMDRLLEDWTRPTAKTDNKMIQPLWYSQARLLSSFFAAFCGEPIVVRKALQDLGHLSWDYRLQLLRVKQTESERPFWNWHRWIERESMKRLAHMTFIFSNLLHITYGARPGFSLTQDGSIEMPDCDVLWQAQNEEEWNLANNSSPTPPKTSLLEVTVALMSERPPGTLPNIARGLSPFGICLAIHAVCTQIWYMNQSALSDGANGRPTDASAVDAGTLLSKKAQAALSCCRELLVEVNTGNTQPSPDGDSPLLFNAFAILRVAFSRAFTGVRLADRELLLHESSTAIISGIQEYVKLPQERGEFTTKSIERSFEGLVIPFQTSALLVRKTAALSWSVEHALAGWDSALFVTKWIFAIENIQRKGGTLSEAEAALLARVRLLVEEEEYGSSDKMLASTLVRLWAGFYDDTWVWGVTPRMGWVLREVANTYEAMSDI